MTGFIIRIFGSKECDVCESLLKAFAHHAIPYEYVDADDPATQEMCDKNNVDELPHIQALYEDNRKAFYTYIGYVSPIVFVEKATDHTKQIESFFNASLEHAKKNVDMEEIKKAANESKPKPCAGCRKNQAQS